MSEQQVIRFVPANDAQKGFLEATEPEVLYSGAFGAGKSRVGCEKGVMLSQMYPGNEGLICRKYASDLTSTTLVTLLEKVIPAEHIVQVHKTEHWIKIIAGDGTQTSRIWWRGIDRPAGIGSMELGWVFVDEGIELELDDWVMLDGRLRHAEVPFRQIFTATNPGAPAHWMHKHFFEEHPVHECDPAACPPSCALEGRPIRVVYHADATENPHNPADYRARMNRLRGVHRERYVLGRWVGYEGLVFSEYDPRTHLIDPFPIPGDWRRARTIDFGTANPFVCQWWAQDPNDDTWIRYREIYMSGRRATVHAQQIRELSKDERIEFTLSDHDAGDRLDLQDAGIETKPARKDVDEGLQAAATMLAPRKDLVSEQFPKGKPGVLFMRDVLVEEDPRLDMEGKPVCTEQEFGGYKWAKGPGGVPKDVPVKKDDHGMDAYRYFALEVIRPETYGLSFGSVDRA